MITTLLEKDSCELFSVEEIDNFEIKTEVVGDFPEGILVKKANGGQ